MADPVLGMDRDGDGKMEEDDKTPRKKVANLRYEYEGWTMVMVNDLE